MKCQKCGTDLPVSEIGPVFALPPTGKDYVWCDSDNYVHCGSCFAELCVRARTHIGAQQNRVEYRGVRLAGNNELPVVQTAQQLDAHIGQKVWVVGRYTEIESGTSKNPHLTLVQLALEGGGQVELLEADGRPAPRNASEVNEYRGRRVATSGLLGFGDGSRAWLCGFGRISQVLEC